MIAEPEPIEVAFLTLLILMPLLDVAASAFFVYLFIVSKNRTAQSVGFFRGRSWLLALMAYSNVVITAVFLFIGYLALRRLNGFTPYPWGAVATALSLLVLGTVPIVKAGAFLMARRSRDERRPPPFGDDD